MRQPTRVGLQPSPRRASRSPALPAAARPPRAATPPPRRRARLRIFVVRCSLPSDPSAWGSFMQWGMISRFQPLRVRGGKAQSKQMFSGLPRKRTAVWRLSTRLALGGRLGDVRRQTQRRVAPFNVRQCGPLGCGGRIRGRFLHHISLRRILPGHDDEPVGHLLIGGDQREPKADVSLSAEIRGTWHGGTPPGFFCNAQAAVRFPTNGTGAGPFLTDPDARSSVRGAMGAAPGTKGGARPNRPSRRGVLIPLLSNAHGLLERPPYLGRL